jgi:hypothetical protein
MEVDEALKLGGIEDEALRKKVCERFAFGMGNFFDQYWFRSGEDKFYPLMCFTKFSKDLEYNEEGEEVDQDEGEEGDVPTIDELGDVYGSSEYWSAHEAAMRAVERYFAAETVSFGLLGDD